MKPKANQADVLDAETKSAWSRRRFLGGTLAATAVSSLGSLTGLAAEEAPPSFFPEHARAAVEAGLHVYMAKPVAADVPGCLQILAAGRQSLQKQRCFWMDYQMPTDPVNQEILKRLRGEGFGKISQVATFGICSGFSDPPKTATLESRLRGLIWVNDVALGCDYFGNYDIHASARLMAH